MVGQVRAAEAPLWPLPGLCVVRLKVYGRCRNCWHAARLTIVPAPLPLPGFTMVAAWHERVHRAPAHQWLRDAVVRALAAG